MLRDVTLCALLGLAACSETPVRPGAEAGPRDGAAETRRDGPTLADGRPREATPWDRGSLEAAGDASVADAKPPPPCSSYASGAQESSPVQKTGPLLGGKLLPAGHAAITWARPTLTPDYEVPFAGSPGQLASHEGVDYVLGAGGPTEVPVRAAADGVVVYVRLGCPQACSADPKGMFCHNTAARECGAGWGNHVVVAHASGILTRYAHLKHGSVPPAALVGAAVSRGQTIGEMGNSGRSETRHLHFELGTRAKPFDPCAPAQSFDLVFDPEQLAYAP